MEEWVRTCDKEVEQGDEKKIAQVQACTLEGTEREPGRPVEQAVREDPECAPAAGQEGTPVPSEPQSVPLVQISGGLWHAPVLLGAEEEVCEEDRHRGGGQRHDAGRQC